MKTSTRFPLCTAFRHTVLRGYSFAAFRADAMAAFVVSLVALPLSMALAIAVGLPPQHGLYTAIVAGAVVPLLGGSVSQVSGPTAAFVVILAPIVSEFGLHGLVWCGLMAGVILVIMGFARMGRLINYVPYPVTTGFTAGIAVVLATLSLNDFLGLGIPKLEGNFIHKAATIAARLPALNPYETLIGVVTLLLLLFAGRVVKRLPSAIVAMVIGTVLGLFLTQHGHGIQTIGNRFSYTTHSGETAAGVPPYPPALHLPTLAPDTLLTVPSFEELRKFLFPALAIAILAALESLLSATVADSMAGTRHDPNAELGGIGIGNILSALAGGIPATGAIARTATNINSGARSPLASTMHALFLLLYVLVLAPYIRYLPMASLAALLIITAYRMSHVHQFFRVLAIAPRSDTVVLLTCFTLTVFVDMVAGVGVGMICASFLLMKRITDLTRVELEGAEHPGIGTRKLPEGVLVYRIRGPLFFGTIEKAFDRATFNKETIRTLIVDIADVPFIDMTGLVAMKSLLASVAGHRRAVYIVCTSLEVEEKIRHKIAGQELSRFVHFYPSLEAALAEFSPPATPKPNVSRKKPAKK